MQKYNQFHKFKFKLNGNKYYNILIIAKSTIKLEIKFYLNLNQGQNNIY